MNPFPIVLTIATREHKDDTRNNDTFRRRIDVAEIERAGVVLFCCRKVETDHGNTVKHNAAESVTHAERRRLDHGCERCVERVAAMIKEFAQRARGACASSLFTVHIIEGRVQP